MHLFNAMCEDQLRNTELGRHIGMKPQNVQHLTYPHHDPKINN